MFIAENKQRRLRKTSSSCSRNFYSRLLCQGSTLHWTVTLTLVFNNLLITNTQVHIFLLV